MLYIDVPRVRGKMAEKGYTLTSLSEKLGINRNTLATYLDNPRKTPYGVVAGMAAILCDTADEAASIFFAKDLRDAKVLYQEPLPIRKEV